MERLDEFVRQRDILTPGDLQGLDVNIVGGGSLGGAILLVLCKMGFGIQNRVTVIDFDRCEAHNLPSQWFRRSHVLMGQAKVHALAELVAWTCDLEIDTVADRFRGDEERQLAPIVILAVDSLAERRQIWSHLRRRDDVRLLVDARMGAEIVDIQVLDRTCDDPAEYDASLDCEAVPLEEPCTHRAVMYTTLGAAALVGSILRAYARREPFPRRVACDFRNFILSAGPMGTEASA